MATSFISVVVPCHNESLGIKHLYDELCRYLTDYSYELILVNDGSTDDTLEVICTLAAKDERVKYISFSRNFGHQKAMKAGIDHAKGDAVITMDADMQHPPQFLPTLIAHWQKGYEVVNAVRKQQTQPSFFKRCSSSLFYAIMNGLSDTKLSGGADFRLFDRKVADVLRRYNEEDLFFRGYIPWIGFKQIDVEFEEQQRFAGKSSFTFGKMLHLAVSGITSFSIRPLLLSIYLGMLSIGITVLYAIYVLYVFFFTDAAISGWTSLILLVSFFGSVMLIILGIIGQYIGLLFIQDKRRPIYIISKTNIVPSHES